MIAFCGLNCTKCEAFIATQNNDDALRAKVAQEWSKLYNAPILPGHINCAGCKDYPCGKLDEVFKHVPEAKNKLDSLR